MVSPTAGLRPLAVTPPLAHLAVRGRAPGSGWLLLAAEVGPGTSTGAKQAGGRRGPWAGCRPAEGNVPTPGCGHSCQGRPSCGWQLACRVERQYIVWPAPQPATGHRSTPWPGLHTPTHGGNKITGRLQEIETSESRGGNHSLHKKPWVVYKRRERLQRLVKVCLKELPQGPAQDISCYCNLV